VEHSKELGSLAAERDAARAEADRLRSERPDDAEVIAGVLAAHQAEAWKNGSGPGWGWTCGYQVHRPGAYGHRPGCGAASRTLDESEAVAGARRHIAERVATAFSHGERMSAGERSAKRSGRDSRG
jgi:hypothetical protein